MKNRFIKEKLRVRSYCQADPDSPGVCGAEEKVPGCRLQAPDFSSGNRRYVLAFKREKQSGEYPNLQGDRLFSELLPLAGDRRDSFSYRREAFYAKNQPDFRVTFDRRILFRQGDLSLKSKVYGILLIPRNMVLMEFKCPGAMPLWAAKFLSEERIYQTSFSKYGTAYQKVILPGLEKEVRRYA